MPKGKRFKASLGRESASEVAAPITEVTTERVRAGELTMEEACALDAAYARSWAKSESYRNLDWTDDLAEERSSRTTGKERR